MAAEVWSATGRIFKQFRVEPLGTKVREHHRFGRSRLRIRLEALFELFEMDRKIPVPRQIPVVEFDHLVDAIAHLRSRQHSSHSHSSTSEIPSCDSPHSRKKAATCGRGP